MLTMRDSIRRSAGVLINFEEGSNESVPYEEQNEVAQTLAESAASPPYIMYYDLPLGKYDFMILTINIYLSYWVASICLF